MNNLQSLSTLPSLPQVIATYGLAAKKSLGQHFLLDEHITDRVAAFGGDVQGHHIIEIGPGPGGLTRSILEAGAQKLWVVEMDDRCIAALGEIQKAVGSRLEIIHGDALEVDLVQRVPAPRKIIANLPYNVGTQMLLNWLDALYADSRAFDSLTLMFQKEVAERIIAEPGSKAYGRLSILAQWLCTIRHDYELPPGAFSPPPKVHSSVVTLIPRPTPLVDVEKRALEQVTGAAFNQRRKMLRGSLKSLPVSAERLLEEAGIDPTLRAERLTIEQFGHLAQCYQRLSINAGSPS